MIKVVDKWVIDSDGRQFIGGKLATRKVKDGDTYRTEQYIQNPFFYSSFAGCVSATAKRLRLEAIQNTDGDMEAAIKAIQAADNKIIKAIGAFDDLVIADKQEGAEK